MAALGAAYVKIIGDLKPLERDLGKARLTVTDTVKKLGKRFVDFGKKAAKAFAFGGIAAGIAGLYALERAITSVVEAANVQETSEAKLQSVIESTGAAAWTSFEALKAMAGAMQNVTTTGDEVIMAGQAILLTFKQIRGEAFVRTMAAALDLSAVMGTDLTSSIVMLGKALNDPVANLGALGRAGIQFTKSQKDLIKGLWESGRVMEAQKIILKELESQFGGTATAAANTFGGAVQQLKNIWGDLLEEIGFVITKNEVFVEIIKDLKRVLLEAIDSVGKWAAANRAMVSGKVLEWWEKLKQFGGEALEVFRDLWPAMRTTASVIGITVKAVSTLVGWGYKLIEVMSKVSIPHKILWEFFGRGSSEKPLTEKIDEIGTEMTGLSELVTEPMRAMADFSQVRSEIAKTSDMMHDLEIGGGSPRQKRNAPRSTISTGINFQEMTDAGFTDALAYAKWRDAQGSSNTSTYNIAVNNHTQSIADIEMELTARGHRG